jgi:hypothetical protein
LAITHLYAGAVGVFVYAVPTGLKPAIAINLLVQGQKLGAEGLYFENHIIQDFSHPMSILFGGKCNRCDVRPLFWTFHVRSFALGPFGIVQPAPEQVA